MAYFLCSSLGFKGKDEDGIRYPKVIEDENQILTNIKGIVIGTSAGAMVQNDY